MAAIASVLALIGGSDGGTASADYSGQTYAKASEAAAKYGYKAIIATVVGDQIATDDCIVVSSKKSGFLNSSGTQEDKAFIFALDCNQAVASPGKPGNSVATPKGKRAKNESISLTAYNKYPEKCSKNLDYCKRLCDDTDKCSTEVLQILADAK